MPSNNDIDKLFSEGFAQEQYPYSEEAWDGMSKLLDQEDQRRRGLLWLSGLAGVLFLALVIWAGSFMMDQPVSDASEVTLRTSPSATSVAKEVASTSIQDDTNTSIDEARGEAVNSQAKADRQQQYKTPTLAQDEQNSSLETESIASNTVPSVANDDDNKTTEDNKKGLIVEDQATASAVPLNGEGQRPAVAQRSADLMTKSAAVTDVSTEQAGHMEGLHKELEPLLSFPTLPSNEIQPQSLEDRQTLEVEADYVELPVEVVRPRRWQIEVSGGAEVSVLMSESAPKLGGRGGLRIGYEFNDKWSLHVGAVYSRKFFAGAGTEFKDQSMFTDAVPEKMEGKSAFLEIPVTVRYHTHKQHRLRRFVEVGVTNFNHRSEWYGFEYKPEDEDPNLMKEIPERSVNKMALGAIRVAYGLSWRAGASTEIGLVPYAQIPIRGIGAGNVSIYNTGLELAIRQRL